MNPPDTRYPDITPLLEAKMRRRRELAALSWEEKIEIVNRMRLSGIRNKWNTHGPDEGDGRK